MTGILQRFIKNGAADLPIGRSSHLNDFVAAQRQRLGSGDTAGVGGDIIGHFSAAGLTDLVHSALEGCAGGSAGDLVVLGGILVDLELAGDGGVFPLDFHSLARLDIDRLVLFVQLIARCGFQLTDEQLALALHSEVVDIDVSRIVRGVFSNRVLILVVKQEFYIINPLFCDGIDLMDDDA